MTKNFLKKLEFNLLFICSWSGLLCKLEKYFKFYLELFNFLVNNLSIGFESHKFAVLNKKIIDKCFELLIECTLLLKVLRHNNRLIRFF